MLCPSTIQTHSFFRSILSLKCGEPSVVGAEASLGVQAYNAWPLYGGFQNIRGPLLGRPYSKDHLALGFILGPLFIKSLIWVVVKILVLFWVLHTIRHVVFRGLKRGP